MLQWKHNKALYVVVVVVVELHINVKLINILTVAQQCFYGKFVSPTTIKRT